MNITIVTVGKLKEKYLKQGIDEYVKRLGAYEKVDIVELVDEKAPEVLSDSEMEQVKNKEGERILAVQNLTRSSCHCPCHSRENAFFRRSR